MLEQAVPEECILWKALMLELFTESCLLCKGQEKFVQDFLPWE